jgi:hypothetical protein
MKQGDKCVLGNTLETRMLLGLLLNIQMTRRANVEHRNGCALEK